MIPPRKTPSLSDIAALTGLTKSAVSLALRHDPRIPKATRQRVEKAAKRIGYRRNAVVAHLMSQLRIGEQRGERATIALLNLNEDPSAFRSHPTIPAYVRGCRSRAAALGYILDEINEPATSLDGKRLLRILQARGLRGCILTGLMKSNRLPANLTPLWNALPCVITGVRTEDPRLPFACADHHAVAQLALSRILASGRRRPALVLEHGIDELVQGRFTAGFLIAQRELPARDRVPPFYHRGGDSKPSPEFVSWWKRHRPDAILTLYHVVEEWLKALGVKVPEITALVQLEARPERSDWAGVDQHNDRTGAAAVDLLVQMIHAGETALSTSPRAMLIEPSWIEGSTLPTGS
jgi:LacI family transcriptional regulator